MDPECLGEVDESVPEAVVEALVDAVWSLPGLRVSFGRIGPDRVLRFVACTGDDERPPLSGAAIELAQAPALMEMLRRAEQVIAIEDVLVDLRTRPVAEAFQDVGARSCLLLTVGRRSDRSLPHGFVALDAPRPRSWGRKEETVLQRLLPVVSMALDNVVLTESVRHLNASSLDQERSLAAVRGIMAAVIHEGERLLTATRARVHADVTAEILLERVSALFSELGQLATGRVAERFEERVDVHTLLESLRPALAGLLPRGVVVEVERPSCACQVLAHRAGLERLILNVVVYAARTASEGQRVAFRCTCAAGKVHLRIEGDALVCDEALAAIHPRSDPAFIDGLGHDLWQARAECILHGGDLRIAWHEEPPAIDLMLPGLR